jgi:serine/threonine protein kinase
MFQQAGPETILSERYEITQRLETGKDGASAFMAYGYERDTGNEVFMKARVCDERGQASLRILNEANQLSSLYHPQVTRVVEADPFDEHPYLVTQRMPGNEEPLEWLVHHANYPMAAEICLAALEVLQYVHEQGMIHRDVKAPNMSM